MIPTTALPLPSNALAVNWRVAPAFTVDVPGVTVTLATSCATIRVLAPVTPSTVARMLVEPFAAAMAMPVMGFTLATAGTLELQVTVFPATVFPAASFATAVNCTVAPRAVAVSATAET